jgi:hypothetical protein
MDIFEVKEGTPQDVPSFYVAENGLFQKLYLAVIFDIRSVSYEG